MYENEYSISGTFISIHVNIVRYQRIAYLRLYARTGYEVHTRTGTNTSVGIQKV